MAPRSKKKLVEALRKTTKKQELGLAERCLKLPAVNNPEQYKRLLGTGDLGECTGRKFDQGKPRYDLLSPVFLLELSQAMTYGAAKYGDRNWKQGIKISRYFGALMRHLWAWWGGEDLDAESGLSHLAHAAANLLMLTDSFYHRKELDDRPNK